MCGGDTQPIIRIVELLPAPFSPRKPNAVPCSTAKSMPSTATKSPKHFVSPLPRTNGTGRIYAATQGVTELVNMRPAPSGRG